MDLHKILAPEVISLDLKASNKKEVIEELTTLIMKSGKVSNREKLLNAVLDRESKMSTGIQHGVAIPHGKTDAVDELIACIGIHKAGVEFEALDGEVSRIFIMTISPVNKTGPHVQFLGQISQVLKDEDQRKIILEASTAQDILQLFIT